MGYDEEIWRFLVSKRDFVRVREIAKHLPLLSDAQINNSLKRLEEDGRIVKDDRTEGRRIFWSYAGLDASDPNFRLDVYDDHGWLFCWLTWKFPDHSSRSTSMNLGEKAQYIHDRPNGLILEYPEWIEMLNKAGRVNFYDAVPFPSLQTQKNRKETTAYS